MHEYQSVEFFKRDKILFGLRNWLAVWVFNPLRRLLLSGKYKFVETDQVVVPAEWTDGICTRIEFLQRRGLFREISKTGKVFESKPVDVEGKTTIFYYRDFPSYCAEDMRFRKDERYRELLKRKVECSRKLSKHEGELQKCKEELQALKASSLTQNKKKPIFEMTEKEWLKLVRNIDNTYTEDTIKIKRSSKEKCFYIYTELCDSTSDIKVYTDIEIIKRIERIGADTEGWKEIQHETYQAINEFLESNGYEKVEQYAWADRIRSNIGRDVRTYSDGLIEKVSSIIGSFGFSKLFDDFWANPEKFTEQLAKEGAIDSSTKEYQELIESIKVNKWKDLEENPYWKLAYRRFIIEYYNKEISILSQKITDSLAKQLERYFLELKKNSIQPLVEGSQKSNVRTIATTEKVGGSPPPPIPEGERDV